MVIALDKHKKPMGFMTEKRARHLMEKKRACIYRHYPMVIIVKDADVKSMEHLPSYQIKIDPGSVHTGIAVVCNETDEVVMYMQVEHRAGDIVEALLTRNRSRRNRRSRETRYRRCKFSNGFSGKSYSKEGTLPPSVKSICDNIINTVKKLSRFINITKCSFEAVRFDTQLMDNPDIKGVEYQQGTLAGCEVREYLFEHYRHTCQYCGGVSGDPVLEWEHKVPKSRGGSDSVKNASLACNCCNSEKNNKTLEEWLETLNGSDSTNEKQKALREARIQHISKILEDDSVVFGSNRYAAWVNMSRIYTEKALFEMFGEVECSSGGRTKYNRTQVLSLPKDHHYDALSVGTVPKDGYKDRTGGYVLKAKAMGRGNRLRGQVNACGIITVKWTDRSKRYNGLQTGDIIRAEVPNGKYKGQHTGRVMIRKSGAHDIRCLDGKLVTCTKKTKFKVLQRVDGYSYQYSKA